MQDETRYQAIDETTHLVELRGEFALATPKGHREELLSLIESGKRLIVDLSYLSWTDETEVGGLAAATKRARELGRERAVVLVVEDEAVRRIFEISGLDRVFPIYTSRRDALAALGCSPELLPEDQAAHEDDLGEQHDVHYAFAHRLLPDQVFADPEGFVTLMRQPQAGDWLVQLWERASDEVRGSDRPPLAADGLDVVIDDDRVVVTMPPPQAPPEAYAAAVVHRDARWRYFVLERLGGYSDGRAVLCEWDADGAHHNPASPPARSTNRPSSKSCCRSWTKRSRTSTYSNSSGKNSPPHKSVSSSTSKNSAPGTDKTRSAG